MHGQCNDFIYEKYYQLLHDMKWVIIFIHPRDYLENIPLETWEGGGVVFQIVPRVNKNDTP